MAGQVKGVMLAALALVGYLVGTRLKPRIEQVWAIYHETMFVAKLQSRMNVDPATVYRQAMARSQGIRTPDQKEHTLHPDKPETDDDEDKDDEPVH